jgi:hypothetical protein
LVEHEWSSAHSPPYRPPKSVRARLKNVAGRDAQKYVVLQDGCQIGQASVDVRKSIVAVSSKAKASFVRPRTVSAEGQTNDFATQGD